MQEPVEVEVEPDEPGGRLSRPLGGRRRKKGLPAKKVPSIRVGGTLVPIVSRRSRAELKALRDARVRQREIDAQRTQRRPIRLPKMTRDDLVIGSIWLAVLVAGCWHVAT